MATLADLKAMVDELDDVGAPASDYHIRAILDEIETLERLQKHGKALERPDGE